MDIKQTKVYKREIEKEIEKILFDFYTKTGLIITAIDTRPLSPPTGEIVAYQVILSVTWQ